MRRHVLFVLLLLTLCSLFYAPRCLAAGPYTLLDGAASNGPGAPVTPPVLCKTWTCQVNIERSPTEAVVYLEGNLDGSVYTRMATWALSQDADYAAGQAVFSVADMPATSIRGNRVSVTGGMVPTITMKCVGVE